MKVIKLKAPDGHATFEVHVYKAGETATIFKGATGVFGMAAGSKTAGIVYVTKGGHGITAQDDAVDNPQIWDWIQEWMQKGMDAQKVVDALKATTQLLKEAKKSVPLGALVGYCDQMLVNQSLLNDPE